MRAGLAAALALASSVCAAPLVACATDPFRQTPYQASLAEADGPGQIHRAWFDQPSTVYDHYVLGRRDNPTALHVQFPPGATTCGLVIEAGPGRVFEDVAPRLADLDGDGENEVIVVRSDVRLGAQLAVYGATGGRFGLIASTQFIGTPHRWLAPVGIADLDGDGRPEIAYVDRPHLTRELVVVRLEGRRLREIVRVGGFSSHRIGDAAISGAVRRCRGGVDIVLPDATWTRLIAVRWTKGHLVARDLGPMSAMALDRAAAKPCD